MSTSIEQSTNPTQDSLWRPAVVIFVVLSVITGLLYPLVVTWSAQAFFERQANGGIIIKGGQAVGAELIGQPFADNAHFWGRLSATAPMAYNASASGGSNLGPTNPALLEAIKARVEALRAADPSHKDELIPVDLVTASASGLDPHISLAAANFQIHRVAKAHHLDETVVQTLVNEQAEYPWLGFLGQARVNVLKLNLALDAIHSF
jgi:K+-transporting ATPase ATPase C chain